MTAKNLSTVTTDLIECYGNTAKNMIQAYRMGNQRVVRFVDQRWEKALHESASKLRAEVRKNALAAQKVVSGMYLKGITITSDRAEVVVDKAVELAGKGVNQVASNASAFEKRTGVAALNTLAKATLPAATMVSDLAGKLEQGSSSLANTVAGSSARVGVATVKRATTRKAATADKGSARKATQRKTAAPKAAAAPKAKVKASTPKARARKTSTKVTADAVSTASAAA